MSNIHDTKFFCKTDFDMKEIERERILYKNFVQVGQDVKEMIKDVLNKRGAK